MVTAIVIRRVEIEGYLDQLENEGGWRALTCVPVRSKDYIDAILIEDRLKIVAELGMLGAVAPAISQRRVAPSVRAVHRPVPIYDQPLSPPRHYLAWPPLPRDRSR
eukprot:SAG31_NODE_4828_length_2921_cov_1.564139_4_plen_106_part_00